MIEWCGLVFVISLHTNLISYEVPPVNVECPCKPDTMLIQPLFGERGTSVEPGSGEACGA